MFAIILVAILTAIVSYYLLCKGDTKYPPGPFALPVFGNIIQLALARSLTGFMQRYKKVYGEVFTLKFGGKNRVVLSGYDTIHTLLVKNANHTSNRSLQAATKQIKEAALANPGLFWAPFPHWKTLRSFTISTLREEGMGKSSMEPRIHEEIQQYISHFIEPNLGKPFNLDVNISKATCNVISQMLYGKRFNYDDDEFTKMISAVNEKIAILLRISMMQSLPFLSYFVKSAIKRESYLWESILQPTMQQYISEHKSNLDRENPVDIIDKYLVHSETAQGERVQSFSDSNAAYYSYHLYIAGTETTATALKWAFLFMCLYPEVKERVQREIDEHLGSHRGVTYKDRLEMSYTEAVMFETLRKGNVVPSALPHSADIDLSINGAIIPAGADLLLNMASVLYDETVFEEPEKFKPERYLTGDIALKKQRTIAFGIGRRLCPGESLARMEFFLFFVTILQRYDVRLADGSKATDEVLDQVKARLQEVQNRRKRPAPSHKKGTKKEAKRAKQTYVFTVGVKRNTTQATWTRDSKYSVKKININHDANYNDVLESCKLCHGIQTKLSVLIDVKNTVLNPEGFNVQTYVQSKEYIGTTRIYIGLPKPSATTTSEKISIDAVKSELLQMKEERSYEYENAEPFCDPSKYTAYGDGVVVRLFMKSKKMVFKSKTTKWGLFFLVPNELLEELDQMYRGGMRYFWVKDLAIQYYFQEKPEKGYDIVADGVWEMSREVYNDFINWRDMVDC